MAKVNSVVDTILGEAVAGSKHTRFEDMLGIASVMANRAAKTGQSMHSIVSAPGQFSAFGKSLPPGASAFRSLAKKALDTVQKLGPVHNATFYATPAATKNLPSGLAPVAATKGHQYFFDPQNRAIRTSVGYVTPSASIAGPLGPQTAAAAMMSPNAFGMPSAPSAPDQSAIDKNLSRVSYSMGPNRPNKPSQDVVDTVRSAVRDTLGPGYGVSVTSGTEDPGEQFGSNRHKTGLAVDVQVKDPTGRVMNATDDQQALLDVAQAAAAKGIKGIGFGLGYMDGVAMHFDKFTPGIGQANQWGSIAKANASLLDQARNFSLMPASFYDKNLPASMPAPPSRTETPAALAAAPFGKIERSALAPAAPRAPDPARFAYDVTPPSQPSGFGLVSAAQAAPRPNKPSLSPAALGKGVITAPSFASARMMAPAPAAPAQTFQKAAFAPAVSVPTSAIKGLMAAVPTAAPQTFVAQPTALMPPAPAPVAPPVSRVSAPVSRPSMLAAPPATAMDVYSGAATTGFANDGSKVTRDQFGNTHVTNSFGVTTTTSPSGVQMGNLGGIFGPAAPSAPSQPSAISGPLGAPGISQQSKGFMGIQPAKTETGNIARGVTGSVIGSALGSTLGPIGSLIGAALGNSIAKGKNPFDALTGRQGLVSFNTPAFGVINAFAPQTGGAFGTFPGAPTGVKGALGGTQSNRSMGEMRGMSPKAAEAIGKGLGGLF